MIIISVALLFIVFSCMAAQAAEAEAAITRQALGISASASAEGKNVIKEDAGQVVEMYLEREDTDART